MKTLKKSIIHLVLALIFLAAASHAADPSATDFTVLFFNDLHGHLQPFTVKTENGTGEVGGIARMAALVKSIRADNDRKGAKTFLVVAGDILQGTPLSTLFRGEPDIECFNRMGVDVVTIGNHEFDFGLDNLGRLRQQAAFPFISANIVRQDGGRPLADSAAFLELGGGRRLLVIGVTTPDLMTTTNPDHVAELQVTDPVSAVVDVFNRYGRPGPAILLSHCRHRTDREIAEALPELAAIIGGHDQILLSPRRLVNGVPIFQAFEKGRYLGRLDFQIQEKTGKAVLIADTYLPVTAAIAPDPEMEALVKSYSDRMDARFSQVIGTAAVFLDGEREHIRWEETTLGNFVTDTMRRHTGTRISLLNAGSLRASINTGAITVADVFRAMPYANELVTLELSGRELLRVLERAVQGQREEEDGGFLHVSGLRLTIEGNRPVRVLVDPEGGPLLPEAVYSVTITDFLHAGGDGYRIFSGKPAVRTGLPLRELLVDQIRSLKTVSSALDGRINRLEGGKTP
ncbi:MAG: bifunctional metallophosphatase/5'-nucleotidase [Thermodesulfobacteriota bacterium]